ncbi:MAG: FadR family transcriptional regulator [Rhodospirillaceae bacterium]|nr:FadR family transcriptional regulator [Rhodospirillaceae bacterium]
MPMAQRPIRRRTKLSDVIVQDVKRLIVAERLKPGDRVPSEPDLIETYRCSKGTVREALKALEVEGLIVIRTGPGGGAYLADADSEPAARMLRNFLHFHHLDGEGVYQIRKVVEPELAASVVGHLDETQFTALENNVIACSRRPESEEEQRVQRILELEFHNILADACPNPLLAFVGRFLNDMLRDLVVLKKAYKPERHQFGEANVSYHRRLLLAYRLGDVTLVRVTMLEHMRDAERHMTALEGEVANSFLLDFPQI